MKNNQSTIIKQSIEKYRKEFGHLFDIYHDREIPGSFSEGENVEIFFEQEMESLATKIREETLKEVFAKYMFNASAMTMYQDQKDESFFWVVEEMRKDMIRICEIENEEKGQL